VIWVPAGLTNVVIARLDPAIHPFEKCPLVMDARVKPAHDEFYKGQAW
jgi:hypothetical protein